MSDANGRSVWDCVADAKRIGESSGTPYNTYQLPPPNTLNEATQYGQQFESVARAIYEEIIRGRPELDDKVLVEPPKT